MSSFKDAVKSEATVLHQFQGPDFDGADSCPLLSTPPTRENLPDLRSQERSLGGDAVGSGCSSQQAHVLSEIVPENPRPEAGSMELGPEGVADIYDTFQETEEEPDHTWPPVKKRLPALIKKTQRTGRSNKTPEASPISPKDVPPDEPGKSGGPVKRPAAAQGESVERPLKKPASNPAEPEGTLETETVLKKPAAGKALPANRLKYNESDWTWTDLPHDANGLPVREGTMGDWTVGDSAFDQVSVNLLTGFRCVWKPKQPETR